MFFGIVFFIYQLNYSQYSYKEVLKIAEDKNITEVYSDSILNTFEKKDSLFAEAAHSFSYYHYKVKKNYELGIKYGLIEIKALENNKLLNENYTNALYNVAKFHNRTRKFNLAIAYYKKAIKTNVFPKKIAQSYCEIGECYFKKGDYFKSQEYYLKGIPLIEKFGTLNNILSYYISFSFNCEKTYRKEDLKLGVYFLKKSDSIIKFDNSTNADYARVSIYNTLGNIFLSRNNYKKSKFYYKKSLASSSKINDSIGISNTSLNLGELYLNEGNDSSKYYFDRSIKFDKTKYNLSETYRNLGRYYINKQMYEKALIFTNKSIAYNFHVNTYDSIFKLTNNDFVNILHKKSLFEALKLKLELLLTFYRLNDNKNYLNDILKLSKLSEKFIIAIVNSNKAENTKFLWRSEVSSIYNLAIEASNLLNDKASLYYFNEANKAFLLQQSIIQNSGLLELPETILAKEQALKNIILSIEKSKVNNDLTVNQREALFDAKNKYEEFKDSIFEIYPYIKESILDTSPVSYTSFKEEIKKDEAYLHFSINKMSEQQASLSLLFSTNLKVTNFLVNLTKHDLEQIAIYKSYLLKPIQSSVDLNLYKKAAQHVFKLFFPDDILEELKSKHLYIIPDVKYENFPFESLVVSDKLNDYLIHYLDVSYTYSFTFLTNNNYRKVNNSSVSVFAPVDFSLSNLNNLSSSYDEAVGVSSILNAKLYLKNKATKANFIKELGASNVIHLSTHATSNSTPKIYFSDTSIDLSDLYVYKSNLDLVVLSACETNIGETKVGEGTLNLSRGFFTSGTKSVVSSLWNVNDKSSSFIMESFYKELKAGKTKSKALNNAKRDYLSKHSLSELSPYYWSSFILIGDTNTINLNSFNYMLISVLILLFMLIIIFFKKRG